LILVAWFDHVEKRFSYGEVQFLLLAYENQLPSARRVKTLIYVPGLDFQEKTLGSAGPKVLVLVAIKTISLKSVKS